MDWSTYYPSYTTRRSTDQEDNTHDAGTSSRLVKPIEIADIGCGFGGLLFALAPLMPDTLMLGLEIRTSVTEFVQNKIRALRHQQAALGSNGASGAPVPVTEAAMESKSKTGSRDDRSDSVEAEAAAGAESEELPPPSTTDITPTTRIPGAYSNIAAIRANTMKFLPNFFPKASLSKIFLCFPDPHFKTRKHKARIVSSTLTSEYAFVLKPGGKVYTITDVEDLGQWMRDRFAGSSQFEEVQEEEREQDECVITMRCRTEEGMKVERNKGLKIVSVWRRLSDPPWPGEEA